MINDVWINLPAKNIAAAKAFYTAIGFTLNTQQGNAANSASFLVGTKNTVLMLFDVPTFKGFVQSGIADVSAGAEVLLSIGVESKDAVDELAQKAIAAGGSSTHQPSDMTGWMYGCLFTDPDGHRWNALYMDMSKMS